MRKKRTAGAGGGKSSSSSTASSQATAEESMEEMFTRATSNLQRDMLAKYIVSEDKHTGRESAREQKYIGRGSNPRGGMQ